MSEIERINVWFSTAGGILDVTWAFGNTYYTDTENEHVMALVDMEGNICGFKISDVNIIDGMESGVINVDLSTADLSQAEPTAHI